MTNSTKTTIGVCIGASSISAVKISKVFNGPIQIDQTIKHLHEGNPRQVLRTVMDAINGGNHQVMVTGRKLRHSVNVPTVTEPLVGVVRLAMPAKPDCPWRTAGVSRPFAGRASLRIQRRAEVAFAEVRQDDDDQLARVLRSMRHLHGDVGGGAATDAAQHALLAGHAARHREGVVVLHLNDLREESEVELAISLREAGYGVWQA